MDTASKTITSFRDFLSLAAFFAGVILCALFMNSFVFQSFTVSGRSMEATLENNDRLVVDRLPVTWSNLQGKPYIPERGQIIVFRNSVTGIGNNDEYVVKRVIAFPGERIVLSNGQYTVYNSEHPEGFNPDATDTHKPGSPTVGTVDVVVPEGKLFVSGDHRQADARTGVPYSLDSRNGLGFIPYENIVGPVSVRIFPFNSISTF